MSCRVQCSQGPLSNRPEPVQDCADIGPHYAVTLRAWRAAWERERHALLRLGYSERFWRKYR